MSTSTDTAVSRPNVTTQPLLLPATDATIIPAMPPAHRTITTMRRTRQRHQRVSGLYLMRWGVSASAPSSLCR